MKNSILFNKNNTSLLFYVTMLSLMVFLRDCALVNINKFIFVALAVIFVLTASRITLILGISFTIPLLCGLPSTYFSLLFLGAIYLKFNNNNILVLIISLFYISLELFACLLYPPLDLTLTVKYLSFLILFFLLLLARVENKKECIFMFCLGVLVLAIIVSVKTVNNLASNWVYLMMNGWFRIGNLGENELSGVTIKLNANSFAYYCIAGTFLSKYLVDVSSSKLEICVNCLIGITIFIAGLFTFSRTYIIICALLLLLDLFFKFHKDALYFFAFIVCFSILSFYFFPELFIGFMSRDTDVYNAGGRTDLFSEYFKVFFSNIRFIMIGTGVSMYKEVTMIYKSMHNSIQQIVVCYGIFASTLFFYILYYPISKYKIRIISFSPFLAVILFSQSIQFLNPEVLMLPYIFGVYAIQHFEEVKMNK